MKFTNISINNFRQYYNKVEFDLSTQDEKNIILIGGRNGYGKTNFLLSIVWCLYGDKISQIDENFKKEIQKDKNYVSFMRESINWTAQKEGKYSFSVSILIEDIDVNDVLDEGINKVLITRFWDTKSTEEKLSIINADTKKNLFSNEEDKFHFINDYVIPVDAAKFVFFDAEKIAEIANLSTADEGSFINDALGKILGLDIYESLIGDLDSYINTLKKEGASKIIQEQIINTEKEIDLKSLSIDQFDEDIAEMQKKIDVYNKQIKEYDKIIVDNSHQGELQLDRADVIEQQNNLRNTQIRLIEKFHDFSEAIPLTILIGKLEEVKGHLLKQDKNEIAKKLVAENSAKIDLFIEMLFNRPPEPENSSLTFKDKAFYYDKAKELGSQLYANSATDIELDFEHDFNNADRKLLTDAIQLVNSQSEDSFQTTFEALNETTNKLAELDKTLNKIDADSEDEFVLKSISERNTVEKSKSDSSELIGAKKTDKKNAEKDITRLEQKLVTLRSKVKVNAENRQRVEEAQKYINTLHRFLDEQKSKHKESLENTILKELKLLMHKLSSDANTIKFIEDVRVKILPSGQGMKVTLLDQDDVEIRKESLSSGEKQIYISSLIKGILCESVQNLPIFIDTPLGRLDEEHRDSLTKKYYPSLSEQVVLFSTNSEITPKRYRDIQNYISKSYLLDNDGNNTTIKQGYFNTVSND